MKNIILTLSILCLVACTKDSSPVDPFFDCEHIATDYKVYDGEEISCQRHFYLTEYQDQQYIQLVSHCEDLSRPFIYNEQCIDICEDEGNPDSDCYQVHMFGKSKGILLVRK